MTAFKAREVGALDPHAQTSDMFPEIAAVPPRHRAALEQVWEAKRRYWERPGMTEPPTLDVLVDILSQPWNKGGIASKSTLTVLRREYGEKRNVAKHPTLLFPRYLTRELAPPPGLTHNFVEDLIIPREQAAAVVESNGRMLEALTQLTLEGSDGSQVTVEATSNGKVTRVFGWRGAALIAAAYSGFGLLDYLSDGRWDGVIRWCSLLAQGHHLRL